MWVVVFSVIVLFQNCSKVAFDQKDVNLEPPPSTELGGPIVCDPFNQSNILDPKLGIQGSLYSAGARLPVNMCMDVTRCTSRDYINLGTKIDATLFLSQIFAPTRNFTEGFAAAGQPALEDANKQLLVEWFALDLRSQLVLDTRDAEGSYQFAVISDDGHTLDIDNSEVIKDEGEHPPRLKCSAGTVNFTKTDKRPFRLTYFQGPRTAIALVMLWRKVDASTNLTDCGTSDGYISNQDSLPQSLSQLGWKVLKPGNFLLAAGHNLCADQK